MVRGSLASVDSLLSAGEEPWRKTFDFFDLDGSGTLSVEDFRKCLQSFGQRVTDEHVRAMLREADLDDSGEVEFEEFQRLMSAEDARKISMGALKRYFETLDKDGSGTITAAELRHAYDGLGHGLSDRQIDIIIDRYDLQGNGVLNFDEFVDFVRDGHRIDVSPDEDYQREVVVPPRASQIAAAPPVPVSRSFWGRSAAPKDKGDYIDVRDKKTADILRPLAGPDGRVKATDLQAAVDLWTRHNSVFVEPEDDPNLHWEKGRKKPGLASVIHKTNHIAIVVSDVGRSAKFYANVVGLQQIRRPDFDRHGAWFTMGNVELHLIKGEPVVHPGTDLIVSHIAIETTDIEAVPEILTQAGVPFRQNVSVPKGHMEAGYGTNETNTSQKIVKQFFLRDPDGYWVEICDCAVLTQYCLGNIQDLVGYDQGISLHLAETAMFVNLAERLAHRAGKVQKELANLSRELKSRPVAEIAQRLGCVTPAAEVDEKKLQRLVTRRHVYGDICQNETEESIKQILMLSNNHVPLAMKIMEIRGWEGAVMEPPVYFEAGSNKIKPDAFLMPRFSIALV